MFDYINTYDYDENLVITKMTFKERKKATHRHKNSLRPRIEQIQSHGFRAIHGPQNAKLKHLQWRKDSWS